MAFPPGYLLQAFGASSFSAAVDMLASNVAISTRQCGVAAMRIQLTLSSAASVSVIVKNSAGTVLGSSALQSGSTLLANCAYAWVYLINAAQTYNLQIGTATTSVIGEVSIAEAPLY